MADTVFCSGCNLVIAPGAPDAFDSQEGYGRVHCKACEAKASKAYAARNAATTTQRTSFRTLRVGLRALFEKTDVQHSRFTLSKTCISCVLQDETEARFTPEQFATHLDSALSAMYRACQNGKSRYRAEILAFASQASMLLGTTVQVTAATERPASLVEVTQGTASGIDRFRRRSAAMAARGGKKIASAKKPGSTARRMR